MEFDLSKENIQPLRGGRNALQLGVALQAQSSEEHQRELLNQKVEFERIIRDYNGEDPLDNWYNYIYWVEQSYPKHGHEGNLVPLLEDCLKLFEDDERYVNDRRFCKMWIKFIDVHQNPLELYQMLHAKGLCKFCSDLYRAWAYYHEVAGDFKKAEMVFQLGLRTFAQPYEELVAAHERMIYAVGQQIISGIDQQRLEEQREALMTLKTYKPGKVSNVRVGNSSTAIMLSSKQTHVKENALVAVYEDDGNYNGGAEAAPRSILSIAKRGNTPKENTLKPGAWTTVCTCKGANIHRTPAFAVHEDNDNIHQIGLILPRDFFPVTHEDCSSWKPLLIYPEPEDPKKIPKYPKALVYPDGKTEYSIEEIKARKYLLRPPNSLNVSQSETQQAIKSILNDPSDSMHLVNDDMQHHILLTQHQTHFNSPHYQPEYVQQHNVHEHNLHLQQQNLPHQQYSYQYQKDNLQHSLQFPQQDPENLQHQQPFCRDDMVQQQEMHKEQHFQEQNYNHQQLHPHQSGFQQQNFLLQSIEQEQHYQQNLQQAFEQQNLQHQNFEQQSLIDLPLPEHSIHVLPSQAQPHISVLYGNTRPTDMNTPWASTSLFNSTASPSNPYSSPNNGLMQMSDIWRSPNECHAVMAPTQKNNTKFTIYEEPSIGFQVQPKGSAMKTPFKDLTDDDLAETGSRGGMEMAAATQPIDGAKNLIICDTDDVSPPEVGWLNVTNTQVFNFNAMHVSTPQSKECVKNNDKIDAKCTKKQLFNEPEKVLSTIFEETKSYGSSLSGGSSGSKSTLMQSKSTPMAAIGEEQSSYHFNLAQNLKANAALRSSLLGDLMECESQETSPVTELPPPIPQCTVVVPLTQVPSDPFTISLLRNLLERINFPGQHSVGYCKMVTTPRLNVKKEVVNIGNDKYLVEKLLGKGTYGSVYKAVDYTTKELVALKIQKPPNKWEFYICREIQVRLVGHPLKNCFMDITIGYFNDHASVFVSDFSPNGSLLDVANLYKQKNGRTMREYLCIYFCIEMLKIVSALHQVKIIHADVKPDNFLVQLIDNTLKLQLIDFGCSIDMSMFPDNATFMRRVTTDHFVCCEMLDGRPWSYHTDLFCVAATAHVLLFDKYIEMQHKDGHWSIVHRFSRYHRVDCWNNFFSSLLNQQMGPANPEVLIAVLSDVLNSNNLDFNTDMRFLVNLLKGR